MKIKRRLIFRHLNLYSGDLPKFPTYVECHNSINLKMRHKILDIPHLEDMTVLGDVIYSLDGEKNILLPIIINTNESRRNVCSIVSDANGPVVIWIGQRVLEIFGGDELRLLAAVYHELGHLVVNHRFRHLRFGHPVKRRLLDEVDADNYAVRHVGAVAVIDMLVDTHAAILEGADVSDDGSMTIGELEVVYRIGRLGFRQYRDVYMSYYGQNSKLLRKLGYGPLS